MDFADRAVLITGASRGIGKAAAKLFHARGARVASTAPPRRGWPRPSPSSAAASDWRRFPPLAVSTSWSTTPASIAAARWPRRTRRVGRRHRHQRQGRVLHQQGGASLAHGAPRQHRQRGARNAACRALPRPRSTAPPRARWSISPGRWRSSSRPRSASTASAPGAVATDMMYGERDARARAARQGRGERPLSATDRGRARRDRPRHRLPRLGHGPLRPPAPPGRWKAARRRPRGLRLRARIDLKSASGGPGNAL